MYLLAHGSDTSFGKKFGMKGITTLSQFQSRIPLHTYNALAPYIERCLKGEENVLWNRKIYWFAMSSGTSAAKSKFIPINRESLLQCHYRSMQTALAQYIRLFPKSKLFAGKTLTLGGNRHIDKNIDTHHYFGDLSAFLLINTPLVARPFTSPGRKIGLIADFEEKINILTKLTPHQHLVSFAGVPSWNLILMRRILEATGKNNLMEVWPDMELFMHGGISFEPYRQQYQELFPSPNMHYMETYNASEGFFSFQTDLNDRGMQLLTNNGIFYEFIPMDRLQDALDGTFTAFDTIESVRPGVVYAMVISTNAGLWRYLIGDTVRFTSTYPHKIVIAGRTQLFINAFGEELMIENAENALSETCATLHCAVNEYTVAPLFMEGDKKGAHQWLIEFEKAPADMAVFTNTLDQALIKRNSDYEAKRLKTGTMALPDVHVLKSGTFYRWMGQQNKLGGQSKVPRLWNTRQYVDSILAMDNHEQTPA